MTQTRRILFAVAIIVVIVAVVLGVDALRRSAPTAPASAGEPTLVPGSIPVYVNGRLVGGFQPADLERLDKVSFVEPAEGKTQEGWLLRDVLLLYVERGQLTPEVAITVSSSSRGKSAQVTWAQADDPENWVMFDLSNRGTLKLVSVMEGLDTRDDWVQDTDKIEVQTP
jgi:hypothetical protein